MMLSSTGFLWILAAGVVFGTIHSFLASNTAKNLAARLFGDSARKFYRFGYILISLLTTFGWLFLVAILPDAPIYDLPVPWIYLTLALQALSIMGVLAALARLNRSDFLGLSNLLRFKSMLTHAESPILLTTGLYHWVRHPIYICTMTFIWLFPLMSWNRLAFDISVTMYFMVGARLEERKLKQLFGIAYEDYRRTTPMFLPIHLT